MVLLARNEAANKWLEEHPAVLGGGAIAIGLLLLAFGVAALMTGKSKGKYGTEFQGPVAYLHGGIMTLFGAAACIFGLVKIVGAL